MIDNSTFVYWFCSGGAIFFGFLAAYSRNTRRGAICLWACSLFVGGLFLSIGAELLGVIQWIVGTLISLVFIFYSALFGVWEKKKNMIQFTIVSALGVGFVFSIWVGLSQISYIFDFSGTKKGLIDLGKILVQNHLLPLELLALTLFIAIVGSGVVSRPDRASGPKSIRGEEQEVE